MRNMSKHHVIPKVHGGTLEKKNRKYICRRCHNELEQFILLLEGVQQGKRIRRSDEFYRECVKFFIKWRYHEHKNMESPSDNGD